MPSLTEVLPLWMQLDQCSDTLDTVHRLQPDAERIRHWPGSQMHHVPTLVLCLRGQVRLIYERRKRLDLQQGESVIIAPGVFHEHAPLRRGCMMLQQGMTPIHSDFHLQTDDLHFIGQVPLERVAAVFHGIINDRRQRQGEWQEGLRDVCHSILHQHSDTTQPVPTAFPRMFSYFVRHVYEGVSAEDIIAVSGLSRSRAYHIWSDCYGSPLRTAIAEQRLYLAKLLLQTDLSISEIAERCGFSSRQQMTRLFQQQERCSPRQWRRQL